MHRLVLFHQNLRILGTYTKLFANSLISSADLHYIVSTAHCTGLMHKVFQLFVNLIKESLLVPSVLVHGGEAKHCATLASTLL